MKIDDFINGLEPVMKMAVNASMHSKAIARHYIKTMSNITGKSEDVIKAEINEIFTEVKEETIKKLQEDDRTKGN